MVRKTLILKLQNAIRMQNVTERQSKGQNIKQDQEDLLNMPLYM